MGKSQASLGFPCSLCPVSTFVLNFPCVEQYVFLTQSFPLVLQRTRIMLPFSFWTWNTGNRLPIVRDLQKNEEWEKPEVQVVQEWGHFRVEQFHSFWCLSAKTQERGRKRTSELQWIQASERLVINFIPHFDGFLICNVLYGPEHLL